jgi:aldose 1-epimerase
MWKYPDIMAHFPFAHSIEMTYRLSNGSLEVETAVFNHSTETMPLSIAFHPYFQVTDAPRDEWTVRLPAKHRVELTKTLVPSGERKPNPYGSPVSLKGIQLDDVFDGVDGDREFSVTGKQQRVSVVFGPKYPVSVVYAPAGRPFICFEPMTGVTNAFNLNHAGKYPELQSIPPGAVWKESFWVKTSGF